jgi:hypothetical protein
MSPRASHLRPLSGHKSSLFIKVWARAPGYPWPETCSAPSYSLAPSLQVFPIFELPIQFELSFRAQVFKNGTDDYFAPHPQ